MMDARSEPEKFSSGDETIVSVRVIDTQGVVAEVTATVREERSIILDLNDSGGRSLSRFLVKHPPGSTTGISKRLMLTAIR
jgi:formyltetrahydrofolate hydrolase